MAKTRFGSRLRASVDDARVAAGLGIRVNLVFAATFWSWLGWRFLAGIGCAMIWVVVESALMCSGNARNRGRLLAAYMMVDYVGTVLGHLLVSKVPTSLMAVLPWVTALVLTAMLPLLFTRIASPSGNHQARTPVWPMLRLRQARLGVNGCILSGIVLGVLYGLMPLYLNHQGVSDGAIGYWMAVMVSAGILGQWPVGRLADRFGRLPVLRVQVLVVILGAMATGVTEIAGLPGEADRQVVRGDVEAGAFAVFHLAGDRILCVEAVNAPPEFMAGKMLIARATPVDVEKLADPAVSMKLVAA